MAGCRESAFNKGRSSVRGFEGWGGCDGMASNGCCGELPCAEPVAALIGTHGRIGHIPMILGIGTDLANIERIQRTLERFGDRFRYRVFTETERMKAERRRDVAGTYAKRWAAKEACSKALGTGLRMGIAWKDMAVTNLPTGQPQIAVTGWAKERLKKMTPAGHKALIHVSLTDDHPWAQAFVVIEARRESEEEAVAGSVVRT